MSTMRDALEYNARAVALCKAGKHVQAMPLFFKCAAIEANPEGGDQKSLGTTFHSMGTAYYVLNKHAEALVSYHSALDIALGLGNEEEEVGRTCMSIGEVHSDLEEHEQALAMYHRCVGAWITVYGSEATEVASIYHRMGGVLSTMGKYSESLEKYEESLKITLKVWGERHKFVKSTRRSIKVVKAKM
jgi:tetratricopeptide (TPR) repeat protein